MRFDSINSVNDVIKHIIHDITQFSLVSNGKLFRKSYLIKAITNLKKTKNTTPGLGNNTSGSSWLRTLPTKSISMVERSYAMLP